MHGVSVRSQRGSVDPLGQTEGVGRKTYLSSGFVHRRLPNHEENPPLNDQHRSGNPDGCRDRDPRSYVAFINRLPNAQKVGNSQISHHAGVHFTIFPSQTIESTNHTKDEKPVQKMSRGEQREDGENVVNDRHPGGLRGDKAPGVLRLVCCG